MTKIVITGATGTIGSRVVRLLANGDHPPTAFVRDGIRAGAALGHQVDVAVGDFADVSTVRSALDGAAGVLLCCGNVPEQVDHECSVIDEARQAGVSRIVKISARGAGSGEPVAYWDWHAQIEAHLRASGLRASVIRPSFLMSNLFAAAGSVRDSGMLFAPAAAARIAMNDPDDVAAVAVAALLDDRHDGGTYVITGPQAIDYSQVAGAISAAVGRPVGFLDVPDQVARRALLDAGLPPFAAGQILAVYDVLRRGGQATCTDVVEELTGVAPRAFATFARDHAAVFGAEAAA